MPMVATTVVASVIVAFRDMSDVVVDADKPVDLRVYAPDGKRDWAEYTKQVTEQYPLVVFSKTICP